MHQKDINEIRQEDWKKLKKITQTADDIVTERVTAIQERANRYKVRIQELSDKKADVFSLPYSKAELLRLAKDALKEGRKQFFLDTLLIPYLKKCQVRKGSIFADHDMRVYIADPDKMWRYVFSIITDEDLETAVEALEEIGISETDRAERIKKLDEEIAALESQIEKELKKV